MLRQIASRPSGAEVLDVWDTILANVVAGVVVAAFASIIVGKWFTNRWDRLKAQQERDHATAAEFYRAYGEFFAAWKAWDAYSRERGAIRPLARENAETLQMMTSVSTAEGALESFLVKLVVEHDLRCSELKCLWCFRTGYKQLRYSVRDGVSLPWWRDRNKPEHEEGFRSYHAFKQLATRVASMLVRVRGGRASDRPTLEVSLSNIDKVTGPISMGARTGSVWPKS
jgi:hypothetical protein